MRTFPFRYRGRLLRVAVVAIDEAWELWVTDEDRRLAYGGRVTVDQAISGWRVGEDRVLELAEETKSNVLTGKLALERCARVESERRDADPPPVSAAESRRFDA